MMLSSFVSVTFLQPVVMILVKNSEHRGKTFTPELVHWLYLSQIPEI